MSSNRTIKELISYSNCYSNLIRKQLYPPYFSQEYLFHLLGLPIVGEAVGPRVVAASWKDDLEARFALVDRVEEAGPINPHPRAAGPSKT